MSFLAMKVIMRFGSTWKKYEGFRLCLNQGASAIEETGIASHDVGAGSVSTQVS